MHMKLSGTRSAAPREKFTVFSAILLGLLILYVISLFIPLFWAFVTSFKDQNTDFRINVIGFPKEWIIDNFRTIFMEFSYSVDSVAGTRQVGVGMLYLNSLAYALGCSFCATIVPCITAYLCARFPYKFSKVICMTVIIVMVIPIVGSQPSEVQMARMLGLYDTIWGLWIMKANFLGMYFLVFFGIFKVLPKGYSEAAKVDGAGNFTVLFRIVLPLVRNTFFTVMLINFITFWNDYQTPLIFMPSFPTISMGMWQMASTNIQNFATVPMGMAGAIIMLIPILAIFLAFHKRLLGNLTLGGLKG